MPKIIADFHIHSKYSRATSPKMDIECLDEVAKQKGINVLGTGDFTHPAWLDILKQKLIPQEQGLFKMKNGNTNTRFVLTGEISCIYSKLGKVRKLHMLLFAPNFETVEKINAKLNTIGNLTADGRPILGLDAKELAKIALDANENSFVVCSHAWTPWFSVFGSKSGFDSLEECFDDYTKHIYAIETGLSSDPAMNWRLSSLDNISLISCGDAHSPAKLGREACVFDTELSYTSLIEAIKTKDKSKFLYTIEFFPEEGKYHYDGHRNCNVSLKPGETKKYNGICPVCTKPLVVGVLSRVEELADRPEGFVPENAIPFKSLIPLQEVIAEVFSMGVNTKKVQTAYKELIDKFGSEFNILLDVSLNELKSSGFSVFAEAISRMRQGNIKISPGYDGEYGKIRIFTETEKKDFSGQKTLF